jgi:hypothetical protein
MAKEKQVERDRQPDQTRRGGKPDVEGGARDELLQPQTDEQQAGTQPGVLGPNADADLDGNASDVRQARDAAYGQNPPKEQPKSKSAKQAKGEVADKSD